MLWHWCYIYIDFKCWAITAAWTPCYICYVYFGERVMKQQGKRNPPKPEQELKRALEYEKGPSHTTKFLQVRRSEKASSACELAAWFSCHLQAAPLEDLLFSTHHSAWRQTALQGSCEVLVNSSVSANPPKAHRNEITVNKPKPVQVCFQISSVLGNVVTLKCRSAFSHSLSPRAQGCWRL